MKNNSIHRDQFYIALLPMFEMLTHKKETVSYPEWNEFLLRTENSIKKNPEQFLGKDLPSLDHTRALVHELFAMYKDGISLDEFATVVS